MIDLHAIVQALTLLTSSWEPWIVVPLGLLIGLIGGSAPGISVSITLAIVLPVTMWMDFLPAMLFLTSIFTGGSYGGGITAILMNMPGATSAVATTFDGYPMAKRGEHNEALGLGLAASVCGMLGGYLLLLFLIDPISIGVLKLGPAEMFMVIAWGLTMIAALGGKKIAKGLFAGLFGIMLGTVGMSGKGFIRGTMGMPMLLDGIPVVPAMMGLLAIGELFNMIGSEYLVEAEGKRKVSFRAVIAGIRQTFSYPVVLIRGSAIGTFIGAIPGVGASISNLISYAETKRCDKDPESFGQGNPKGVVAAESGNSSSEGGAMATLLALGIPGGAGTAVMLAAFAMHNITGGPRFINHQKDIVYAIILSNFAQGALLLVIGLLFIRVATNVVKVPIRVLVPSVLLLAVFGSYTLDGSMVGPVTLFLFSLVGWLMLRYQYPVAAAVVGLLLGGMAEDELLHCYQISGGRFDYFLGRPVAIILFFMLLASLLYRPIKGRLAKRRMQA